MSDSRRDQHRPEIERKDRGGIAEVTPLSFFIEQSINTNEKERKPSGFR